MAERQAGGWAPRTPKSRRAGELPQRYDLSIPGNQRKLEAADALARLAEEAGMTLIEMALAFVIRHPAVTAAIIGPRTMEHLESQLPAAEVTLSDEVLDRIDEIVPPGSNVNPADGGWQNPALAPAGQEAAGVSQPRREQPTLYTVGHSTRSFDELVAAARGGWGDRAGRRADGTRARGATRSSRGRAWRRCCPSEGSATGTSRRSAASGARVPDSPNAGWEHPAFRGYADHMADADFREALGRLEAIGRERSTTVMCAEAQWWRCHRRLIADALTVRGWRVLHLGLRSEPVPTRADLVRARRTPSGTPDLPAGAARARRRSDRLPAHARPRCTRHRGLEGHRAGHRQGARRGGLRA